MRLPVAEEDAAWARMDLPLTPREVRGFLANIEVFLRINPCIEFESLLLMPGGFLRMAGRNDSNNQDFDTAAAGNGSPATIGACNGSGSECLRASNDWLA